MRRFYKSLVLSVFLIISNTAMISAQGAVAAMSVGSIIEQSKEAIEEIIELAFDRLDFTLLAAAMEARATVNSASTQFQDSLTTSVDELDSQQRRIITDLQALNSDFETSISKVSGEIRQGTNQAISDIRLLLSDNPGAVYVSASPAIIGDNFFEIEISGTALSKARMEDFRVSTLAIDPEVIEQDDGKIVYRVPIASLAEAGLFGGTEGTVVELPVAFSFVEESWWPWSSPDVRPFSTTAVLLPQQIGTARAVFSVTSEDTERRAQTRGPFDSDRVQSRVRLSGIRAGSRNDTWIASPSEGWRIDLSSAEFNFRLLNGGCSSSRSRASWVQQTEQILRVAVTTSSDRRAGATCSTRTLINFTEWRSTEIEGDFTTDDEEVLTGDAVLLSLGDDPNVKRARLSHIEVTSPMFGDGTKIFRINDLPDGISAEYDAAAQSVFLTIGYRR